MTAIDEMRLLADAAQNVPPPDEPLRFFDDPLVDDDEENERILRWIITKFFQGSSTHYLFFDIGLQGSLVLDEQKLGLWAQPSPPEWLQAIESNLRDATRLVLLRYRQLETEGGLWGELPAHFDCLRRMLGLRKNFAMTKVSQVEGSILLAAWDACLEASDLVLETAFHRHAPIANATVDWGWLQQGVAEMRERGEHDAGGHSPAQRSDRYWKSSAKRL
jgi:hypothetical protein